MNIFRSLPNPAEEKKVAFQKYLQKRGITEEEYKQEKEELARKEHQKYLDRLGITEEEYQKREARKAKIKAIKEKYAAPVGCTLAVLAYPAALALIYGVGSLINSSDVLKTIILIVAAIWIVGLVVIYIISPIYLFIYGLFEQSTPNKYIKAIIVLIITLLVLVLIGVLMHTCYGSSGGGGDYYEPGKLRPDKF